jgi:hypothetical protein
MTSMAAGLGNIAMLGNSINTIFKNLSNPDLSGWQKFSSILMAISFGAPMVSSLLKNLGVT